MQINDKFFYINIRDYLALGNDDKAGEPMLARVLSGFSCPKNLEYSNASEPPFYRLRAI